MNAKLVVVMLILSAGTGLYVANYTASGRAWLAPILNTQQPTPTQETSPTATIVPPTPSSTPAPTKKTGGPDGLVLVNLGSADQTYYCKPGSVETVKSNRTKKTQILAETKECRENTFVTVQDPKGPCYTDEQYAFLMSEGKYLRANCVDKIAYDTFGPAVLKNLAP